MKYGKLPIDLGFVDINSDEMFFYQYLPIKMNDSATDIRIPSQLLFTSDLIGNISCNFIAKYGLDRFVNSYMYLTAKNLFVNKSKNLNRQGWHSDGFMTNDINYIWSNNNGTEFIEGQFDFIQDDVLSIDEMNEVAKLNKSFKYPEKHLLELDQYVIHKCSNVEQEGMRLFIKVSISKDKYDLKGNSVNYLFDYNWLMRDRLSTRNIPQKI